MAQLSATVDAEPAAEKENEDHDDQQEFHGEPSFILILLVFIRGTRMEPILVIPGRLSVPTP